MRAGVVSYLVVASVGGVACGFRGPKTAGIADDRANSALARVQVHTVTVGSGLSGGCRCSRPTARLPELVCTLRRLGVGRETPASNLVLLSSIPKSRFSLCRTLRTQSALDDVVPTRGRLPECRSDFGVRRARAVRSPSRESSNEESMPATWTQVHSSLRMRVHPRAMLSRCRLPATLIANRWSLQPEFPDTF